MTKMPSVGFLAEKLEESHQGQGHCFQSGKLGVLQIPFVLFSREEGKQLPARKKLGRLDNIKYWLQFK